MTTRTPLLPKSALDPLCLAVLPVIGIVGFRVSLVVDHPLVPTASMGLLALAFAWAGLRFASKFEPSHLSPLVLLLIGVSSGLGVGAGIAGFAGSSTGVLPTRTTCRGPRTEAAGFTATTWPVTSQSNRWRTAARRCLAVGAVWLRVSPSIQVATSNGCTAVSDGTPAASHQVRNSPAART